MAEPDVLVEYLRDSEERCPHCRYVLRGCTSRHCPECGLPLRIELAPDSAVVSWWLTAVFGAAVNVVLSLLVLLPLFAKVRDLVIDPRSALMVTGGFAPSSQLPDWRATLLATLLLLAAGAFLCWLLGHRRWFARLPVPLRAVMAFALLLTPLLVLGLLYAYTRLMS